MKKKGDRGERSLPDTGQQRRLENNIIGRSKKNCNFSKRRRRRF